MFPNRNLVLHFGDFLHNLAQPLSWMSLPRSGSSQGVLSQELVRQHIMQNRREGDQPFCVFSKVRFSAFEPLNTEIQSAPNDTLEL